MKKLLSFILLAFAFSACFSQSSITRDKVRAKQSLRLVDETIVRFQRLFESTVDTFSVKQNGDAWKKLGTDSLFYYNGSAWVHIGIFAKTVNTDNQNLGQVLDEGNVATDDINMNGQSVINLLPDPYDSGWNSDNSAAPKNDVYDKIEAIALVDSIQIISDSIYLHVGVDSFLVGFLQDGNGIVDVDVDINRDGNIDVNSPNYLYWRDDADRIRFMMGNFGTLNPWELRSGDFFAIVGVNETSSYISQSRTGTLAFSELDSNAMFTDLRPAGKRRGVMYATEPDSYQPLTWIPKKFFDDNTSGVFLKLSDDTTQVLKSGLQVGEIDTSSVVIGDATLGSIGTASTRRLFIQSASDGFSSYHKGDFVKITNATGLADGFYMLEGSTEGDDGSGGQFWINESGVGVGASADVRVYNNLNPEYDTVKVDDGSMTIDDSFQPSGRKIIIQGLGGGWSPYDGYADSILITNSNQTELPNGHYAIYSATGANIIVEHPTSVISSQTFTGDVKLIFAVNNYQSNFKSGDSTTVNGDLVTAGAIYHKNLQDATNPSKVMVIDPVTGESRLANYIDSTLMVPQHQLDTAKTNLRNEIANAGGGGGGLGSTRSTEVIIFDEFFDSTGISNRYGETHWLHVSSNAGNTIEINDASFTANDLIGSINMTGITSGAFQSELNLGSDFVCDEYDWVMEVRWKTNNVTADLHPVMGLINGNFNSPSTGVYIFNSFAGTAFGVCNSSSNSSVDFTTDFTGSWQTMKITHDNSTGTVEFFVDDVSQGTATSNIPTGANHRLVVGYFGDDAEPTADDGLTIDYIYFKATISR